MAAAKGLTALDAVHSIRHEGSRALRTRREVDEGAFPLFCDGDEYRARLQDGGAEIVAYAQNAVRLVELNGFVAKDKNCAPLDMAVFVGREDRISNPGSTFFELSRPGPVIRVGDPNLVAGYPAANVSVPTTAAEFGIMQLLHCASSVSEHRIVLANGLGDRIFHDFRDPPRSREEVEPGALSGSPAFHLKENGEYSLVGIVTDGEQQSGTILISRIDCLLPDGSINHPFSF